MNALIDTMEKDTLAAGEWLMREGEPGDAMYVIKTGKLEVFVGGSLTRHLGRGGAVGELALLYHTPRSASVKVRETQSIRPRFCSTMQTPVSYDWLIPYKHEAGYFVFNSTFFGLWPYRHNSVEASMHLSVDDPEGLVWSSG